MLFATERSRTVAGHEIGQNSPKPGGFPGCAVLGSFHAVRRRPASSSDLVVERNEDTIAMDTQQYLEDELKNFRDIAQSVSPSPDQIPQLEGVDIHGTMMPLHGRAGGDHVIYIDFNRRYDLDARIEAASEAGHPDVVEQLRLTKTRAGILIADVAGHRATDAMVAAMLHQAFLLGVLYELDTFGEITTRLFEHVNTRFFRTTSVNKYFTMLYGEISDRGGFRFLSAGHQPPRVFSREFGRFMTISDDRLVSVPPVGMLPSAG